MAQADRRRAGRGPERDDGRPGRRHPRRRSTTPASPTWRSWRTRRSTRARSTARSAMPSTWRSSTEVTARAISRTGATPARRMREVMLDIAEGADIVMVKPALAYLDVIADAGRARRRPRRRVPRERRVRDGRTPPPNGAGSTSTRSLVEHLTSIKRAGADIVLTYFARWFAESAASGRTLIRMTTDRPTEMIPLCDPDDLRRRPGARRRCAPARVCRRTTRSSSGRRRAIPGGVNSSIRAFRRSAVSPTSWRGPRARRSPTSREPPTSTSCRATARSSSATPTRRSPLRSPPLRSTAPPTALRRRAR